MSPSCYTARCLALVAAGVIVPSLAHAEVADKMSYPWDTTYLIPSVIVAVFCPLWAWLWQDWKRHMAIAVSVSWILFLLLSDGWLFGELSALFRRELTHAQNLRYGIWLFTEACLPLFATLFVAWKIKRKSGLPTARNVS